MINTVNTKQEQLTNGYFKIGSGEELLLIIGSCRSVPYLNYFKKVNETNNKYTIAFIDPFNFLYDKYDNRIDGEANIISMENNDAILDLFKNTSIIIHEHYANFGMFNFDKNATKNVYKFGMQPSLDICIPSWNDVFVLFKDIFSFDIDIRKRGLQDINVTGNLSNQIQGEIAELSIKNLQRFYNVCNLSDIPEMGVYFKENIYRKRLWHTYNHVNKNFTMAMFNFIDKKFLHLNLPEDFYNDQKDIFANSFTPLTEYDIRWFGYNWSDEEIQSIL